jgi:hypothetical protein
LRAREIARNRPITRGYGKIQVLATNATVEGRI